MTLGSSGSLDLPEGDLCGSLVQPLNPRESAHIA